MTGISFLQPRTRKAVSHIEMIFNGFPQHVMECKSGNSIQLSAKNV